MRPEPAGKSAMIMSRMTRKLRIRWAKAVAVARFGTTLSLA